MGFHTSSGLAGRAIEVHAVARERARGGRRLPDSPSVAGTSSGSRRRPDNQELGIGTCWRALGSACFVASF